MRLGGSLKGGVVPFRGRCAAAATAIRALCDKFLCCPAPLPCACGMHILFPGGCITCGMQILLPGDQLYVIAPSEWGRRVNKRAEVSPN